MDCLREIYQRRYRVLKHRSASQDTVRLWQSTLDKFAKMLRREPTLADLNDMTVSQFADAERSRGLAAATVNRDIKTLLALWRWCHRQRMVEAWPNVQLDIEPLRTPVAWTEAEFNQLLRAVSRMRLKVLGTEWPRAHWWTALLLLCFDTAERIGAVRALRWNDVDLSGRWVRFRAETRKGRARDNTCRIAEDTAAWLATIQRDKGLVFFTTQHRHTIYAQFCRLCRDAGLPDDGRHKFHCIRRTTASFYAAAGGDAMKLLGHASQINTARYIDPRIVRPVAAHSLLFKPTINTENAK